MQPTTIPLVPGQAAPPAQQHAAVHVVLDLDKPANVTVQSMTVRLG